MTPTRPQRMAAALAAAASFSLVLAGCASSGTEESASEQSPDTAVVAWTGDMTSIDPPFSAVEWNREASLNLYSTLVNYAVAEQADGTLLYTGLDVAPGLATDWTVEGATVTFTIDPDAVFYPSGNPVTAADVLWSFDRAINVPGGYGAFNANLAGLFDAPSQIEVIDDKTVAITFTDADGEPMLLNASLPSMRFPQFGIIDSVAALEQATDDDPWAAEYLAENALGSGPYYISSRTPNEEVVFTAVPEYWGETPAIETITARITSNADLVALMETGDIDFASSGLGPAQFDALEASGFQVVNQSVPNILQLLVAVDDPDLTPEVREAIAYAIPYEQLVDVAFSGRGERALSYVNPAAPEFEPAWEEYATDLEAAQSLLDDAGVSGLSVPLYYDSGVATNEDVALLIQDSLAGVGIEIVPTPQPTAQFAEQRTARAGGDTSTGGLLLAPGVIWLDDADPSTDVWFKSNGSGNWSHYANADVDALHLDNRFNPDADARAAAYVEVQQTIAEELPTIPLVVTGRTVAMAPELTGASFLIDSHNRYYTLSWE